MKVKVLEWLFQRLIALGPVSFEVGNVNVTAGATTITITRGDRDE